MVVSSGFRKLWWIKLAADHQTGTTTGFDVNLALKSALELLLGPTTDLVVAGCHINSTFLHMSQSDGEMVHNCIE